MKKNAIVNIFIAVIFFTIGILIGKTFLGEQVDNSKVSGTMSNDFSTECGICRIAVSITYELIAAYNYERTPENVNTVLNEVFTFDPIFPKTLNDKKHLIITLIVNGRSAVEISEELYDCSGIESAM